MSGMTSSPSKCTVLHVRPSGSNSNLRNILAVLIYLVLIQLWIWCYGVTYCNRLKFSTHVDKIVHKASQTDFTLFSISLSCPSLWGILYVCQTYSRVLLSYLESCLHVRNWQNWSCPEAFPEKAKWIFHSSLQKQVSKTWLRQFIQKACKSKIWSCNMLLNVM